ncbi:MAG: TolC family outer membrane protein [Chelatococcus sp.]|jgi:outer membrane protein|nr:TolC family outer membrane protein [Chelatococcus sp. HY11]MBX3539005.1 TolC family outer membrane protein [Chelatococcus sp.]CAH1671132.1 Outer membrane efflux protein BepC [Hyphomicrobiales bacterium]MBS7738423.1 TolC family outer membrane protein [Chelatococcus sp. HY11]MBX3542827.1 TolC family outer membrane protein [Chelatococcus sp.]CAH1676651.1 Outer membrane efflux protein BepC [Hyphomicrobiales bacterium]
MNGVEHRETGSVFLRFGKVIVAGTIRATGSHALRLGLLVGAAWAFPLSGVHAETLYGALGKAYTANPTLNMQRASLRATNEGVPQALSGYRPTITGLANAGVQSSNFQIPAGVTAAGGGEAAWSTLYPRGLTLQINQNIFTGGRTMNSVRQAEAAVQAGREQLRFQEQSILYDGAQAYMNVLQDTAVLSLQRNNVEVLEEQLRQTRDRFNVGEVTRTDVAQAEAALATGHAQEAAAAATLKSSIATYRQIIGDDPRQLAPGQPVEKFLPRNVDAAVKVALGAHPAIIAGLHSVDAQEFQVKILEAQLLPQLGVTGSVSRTYDNSYRNDLRTSASVVAQLNVPIYEGGLVYSQVRQAKEQVGQARIQVDVTREQVRQQVIASWAALDSAKQQIAASQSAVEANEIALAGVREEAKVGQRTTLDVLNAQQTLLSSRVQLVRAQRDRIVASYNVLGSIGRLSVTTLGVRVTKYDAKKHYEQVRDKWGGLQTPDGR